MPEPTPCHADSRMPILTRRESFACNFGVRRYRFTYQNLAQFLRLTGEPPGSIQDIKDILYDVGIQIHRSTLPRYYNRVSHGGLFDHVELWGRHRRPWMIVGHPYPCSVNGTMFSRLSELNSFSSLRSFVDDRESYYGFGTHHVRIERVRPPNL